MNLVLNKLFFMSVILKVGNGGYVTIDGQNYKRGNLCSRYGTGTLAILNYPIPSTSFAGEFSYFIKPTAYSDYLDGDNANAPFASLAALRTWMDANFEASTAVGASGAAGVATAAKQDTGNTTLTAISGKLPASLGAKAKTGSLSVTLASDHYGQTTMSASVPVTMASDQTQINVGADTAQVSFTPTITSGSAYSAGYTMGGIQTISNAMRVSSGKGTIASLLVTDASNQKSAIDILFFDSTPSGGTYTDRAALVLAAADLPKLVRKVSVAASDYVTYGSYAIADIGAICKAISANGGTSLYALIVCQGTPTYTSTSALSLKVGLYRD